MPSVCTNDDEIDIFLPDDGFQLPPHLASTNDDLVFNAGQRAPSNKIILQTRCIPASRLFGRSDGSRACQDEPQRGNNIRQVQFRSIATGDA
jgi:hypothetical protein